GAEHAESGSDRVAAAFDGELDDIFAVEIIGIFREAGAGGMFDALIDRKNGDVACTGEAAGVEQTVEIRKDPRIAVRRSEDAVDKIRARKMKALFCDFGRMEAEQGIGFCAEKLLNGTCCSCCGHCLRFLLSVLPVLWKAFRRRRSRPEN